MSKGVKVGDIGTAHDGFPETPILSGSPDVKFDGQPAARVGDPLLPHSKPKHPPHPRTISSGSSTVFINGKPAAITGGEISCGGVTIGSGTVNIGDKYQPPTSSPLSKLESGESKKITTARTNSANSQTSQPIRIPSGSGYWPPYNPLAKDGEKELNVEYTQDIVKFAVLKPDEWAVFFDSFDKLKTLKNTVTGLYDAKETAKALGGLGVTALVKNIDGVDYVILKNHDKWSQTLLHGGVFKANNAQVIKLGLGALDSVKGMARFVKVSAPMEILVGSGINVLQFIVNDEYTLTKLGVEQAKLFVNVLIVSGISLGVGMAASVLVPVTFVGGSVIFAATSVVVWWTDKQTDFQEKLVVNSTNFLESVVNEVIEVFDGTQ